jgi:hypothetical protein
MNEILFFLLLIHYFLFHLQFNKTTKNDDFDDNLKYFLYSRNKKKDILSDLSN